MATIHTNRGDIILDDDSIYLQYKWNVNKRGYARRCTTKDGKRITVFLHRLVINASAGEIVDHINRNPLDNRLQNLRIASIQINSINRRPRKNSLSKFKGVSKHKKGWQVYVNKKYIGIYKCEKEAAKKYDEYVVKEYGNVAATNKMLGLL